MNLKIILLVMPVTVCATLLTMAQSLDHDRFEVVVNEATYTRYFTILDVEKTLITIGNRDYQWYKSNKVLTTKGGQGGRLLHGSYKEHYLNKNLKTKGKFFRGLKRGKWKTWHINGMTQTKCRYLFGQKWGRQFVYDERGNLSTITRFRRGMKSGRTKTYQEGEVKKVEIFRKDVLQPSKAKESGSETKTITWPNTEENEEPGLEKDQVRKERRRLKELLKRTPKSLNEKTENEASEPTP